MGRCEMITLNSAGSEIHGACWAMVRANDMMRKDIKQASQAVQACKLGISGGRGHSGSRFGRLCRSGWLRRV